MWPQIDAWLCYAQTNGQKQPHNGHELKAMLWAPQQMFLFGTTKGHNGLNAISKIMRWMAIVLLIVLCLWEGGLCIQFLRPKCLLF